MNNYPHPNIAGGGRLLEVVVFSLFAAVAIYSVIKSIMTMIRLSMGVDLSLNARPKAIFNNKVSGSEMIPAGF